MHKLGGCRLPDACVLSESVTGIQTALVTIRRSAAACFIMFHSLTWRRCCCYHRYLFILAYVVSMVSIIVVLTNNDDT